MASKVTEPAQPAAGRPNRDKAEKTHFTVKFLDALKPASPGKRRRVWDTHTKGLALRITDKGAKSFVVMRHQKGKPQPVAIVLGRYPDTTLKDARTQADRLVGDLRNGIDPRERQADEAQAKAEKEKAEAARKANVFSSVAEEFIDHYLPGKRTAVPIAQLIRRKLVTAWGPKPITDIRRADIIALLEHIGGSKGSPAAAHQTLIYARLLFDWAIERGIYGITTSPCHPIKVKKVIPGLPQRRKRILSDTELLLIWKATADLSEAGYPLDHFVRLLLVLGVRRGSLAGATREQFDLAKAEWVIPRTKNDDPHLVPLPALAVRIIEAMPTFTGPYVFSTTFGKRPISSFHRLKQRLDDNIAKLNGGIPIADWRNHDLRRTMRTGLSALQVPPLVAEIVIGHRLQGIQAVYDLHSYANEKRDALEQWAHRLISIVEPPPAKVLKFPIEVRA